MAGTMLSQAVGNGVPEERHAGVSTHQATPRAAEQRGRRCALCGNTHFRRSNVRGGDYLRLFAFQLPVRCMRCNQRIYVPLPSALSMPEPKSYAGTVGKGAASWQDWTTKESAVLRRPVTSMNSRATRLGRPEHPAPPGGGC